MILTALKELAEAEHLMADPDFEPKPVTRVVELARDGRLLGVTDLRQPDAKGKPRAVHVSVPKTFKRSGKAPPPNYLYENAKFAFGVEKDRSGALDRKDDRLAAFVELVAKAAGETHDPGLVAIEAFLRHQEQKTDREAALPADYEPTDWFVFRLHGDEGFVHTRPAVQEWWRRQRRQTDEPDAFCLVTGVPCVAADKHDAVNNIPGTKGQPVALVVCKSPTDAFDSYDLDGGKKAPVGRYAAEAYVRGLKRLLDPRYPHPERAGELLPPRAVRLGADTAAVFWTANPGHAFGDDVFAVFDAPNPERVREMLRAPHTGRGGYLEDTTPFYALTLSGGQGRATVRDWFTSSVGEMAKRIGQWFSDLALAFPFEQAPVPALNALLRSTVLKGKDDNIPPNLAAEVFQAVLRGGPLPLTLLHAALRRNKAEGPLSSRAIGKINRTERTHLRMQLIKAVLLRLRRQSGAQTSEEELTMLDENCKEPGYVLGRLFAVLESLQYAAQRRINVTIADRYYGAASSTPNAVFHLLERLSHHHLHKLRGTRYGQAVNIEKRIGAIMDLLPARHFPTVLAMEEQGLFALGYYHQRQAQFRGGEELPGEDETAEALAQG